MEMAVTSALTAKLQALGLTENECKAYLTVLRLGTSTAVQVSRESHLQRTEIYQLMSRLVSKGLVEETIDRPKRYRPTDVKRALPSLAVRLRDRLNRIAKDSEQLATKLEGLATKVEQASQEEVRVVHGPHFARRHLLESLESAKIEFWGMAGRTRPLHISDRVLAKALRLIKSKGIKVRLIVETDSENLKRVGRLAAAAEVAHYRPIPAYVYGIDDKSVTVSLAEESASRLSQMTQLVITHHSVVQAMREYFNILWKESTPYALHEAVLLGNRILGSSSFMTRGREEAYIRAQTIMNSAKDSIRIYAPHRLEPVRLLKGLGETFLNAHRRGVIIQAIITLSEDNLRAVKTLAKFMELRHTNDTIGLSMDIVDDFNVALSYVQTDSEELQSHADHTIQITSRQGIRHLGNLFNALWQESVPIEGLLQKHERPPGESSNLPG
jgi:sugar-specific transcriptional regulator TrmB